MSEAVVKPKKPVYLSASRIDCFHTCSALYAAKYLSRIPDPVGEAARRGSVAHDTLEMLLKYKRYYEAAILLDSCTRVPRLWKLVRLLAKKYEVLDDASLEMIDDFIMIALQNDFFGPPGTYQVMPELEFNLQINRGDGRKFNLRGFIDQMFFVRDKTGEWLDIKDFKTGAMFRSDKFDWNVQAMMYLLVARHLYPQFDRRRFRFQFVKGKNVFVEIKVTEDQLNGFEWMLSELQNAMDSFTVENALDNPYHSALEGKTCWMFGKPCAAKDPISFYGLMDKDGNHLASAFKESELEVDVAKGQKIERRRYLGCPVFYDPKTGLRRNLN